MQPNYAQVPFQADVFWSTLSIDPQVLHLWLETYHTMNKPPPLTSNFAHGSIRSPGS
jgi:hypothetical protein